MHGNSVEQRLPIHPPAAGTVRSCLHLAPVRISSDAMNERRKYERYPLVVGSDIDSDEPKVRFGLTQDLSRNGARLLTLTSYAVGSRLALKIFISEHQVTECDAKVIRCEKVEDRGIWRHEIAVEVKDLLDDEIVSALLEANTNN